MAAFHVRRLPHYDTAERPIFLTWRPAGSLPANRNFPSPNTAGKIFLAMDRLLDTAAEGPLYLRQPNIALMVIEALRYQDRGLRHYRLHAYVVMANHVHLLISPRVPVSRLMQSLKRFTARKANLLLGRTGKPFWQDESYDRLVRDATEYDRILYYIEMNPVSSGLAATPGEYPWSSAAEAAGLAPGWDD
jgi:REP element-mobilizing transposase RayT